MLKKLAIPSLLLAIVSLGFTINHSDLADDWGFFGHKRINRLSIFTLPPSLFGFYKKNVEYITEHAVDPDKRRYATVHEGVRHYIDLDHWGEYPYDNVPRTFSDAVRKYLKLSHISPAGDTTQMDLIYSQDKPDLLEVKYRRKTFNISQFQFDKFYKTKIFNNQAYYEGPWTFPVSELQNNWKMDFQVPEGSLHFEDGFSEYGILPYNMLDYQNKLTAAFVAMNPESILRISADFGHYIGDAHVPLHTTSNYNGQLTNQLGIHAFWESRIPELLADKQWDFFVGQADYIEEPASYFWDIVLASNRLVDSVLSVEKRLSNEFPEDSQFCQDLRNGNPVRTQCADYTAAFDEAMGGMVEDRMCASILSIGSCWYTAWVDAGRPDLSELYLEGATQVEELEIEPSVTPFRAHEN
ncbi:MAG: hypothetical protein HKN16_08600 [Saprospiraceae bacterium]|nr:hypothetical protein [Saprospiraceae bacterium]